MITRQITTKTSDTASVYYSRVFTNEIPVDYS